jgi:alkylation response protein AidB-like acyl-CoA dehydrogenase
MKTEYSDSDSRFLEEVRDFLQDSLPESISEKVRLGKGISKDELNDWTGMLNEKGWAAPNWPKEHGGTGWSMVQRHLFDVECRLAHAPPLSGFGFNMVGPAIIRYGSEAQQRQYLPKIMTGEEWWCQGYSEPEAGSDLASVRTQAVSDGDDYVINGSKIWTSAAESADRIFCLVRTDPNAKPQRGISFLLIDMKSPGITVQPLLAYNGKRLWNQVFFDNVRVPRENRLGKENEGWGVAKNLLGNERLLVSRVAENRRLLMRIIEIIAAEEQRGVDFEHSMQGKLSELDIRLRALDASALRLLIDADRGGVVGAEPSMLKLLGSQLVQDMDTMALEEIAYYAMPLDSTMRGENASAIGPDYCDMLASGLFHHRGFTIAGGSSEVQHNIIAKGVLGLA